MALGSDNPRDLGVRIRLRREELGISQAEVAERAGISRQLVSRIEHGQYRAEFGGVMAIIRALGAQLVIDSLPGGRDDDGRDDDFRSFFQES
jgi:transcriptional regulator with XRE-family HTH domain